MVSLFADDEDETNLAAFDAEVDEASAPDAVEVSPRENPDLVGHETVEKLILADFNAGRMPHAVILAGQEGIGKATLAYRLARFLLSQGQDTGVSLFGDAAPVESLYLSPDHPVFRRVASGGHADLLTIEREFDEKKGRFKNEISVDAARAVAPFLRKTAAEGGWRVVIVDGAEYLNNNSQNALLKILEEPPEKTVLILTTAQPGGFLPTIRSRCRMLSMDSLSEKNLHALLDKYAPGLSNDQKQTLSRLAEGSIGRALQFESEDGVALYKSLLTHVSTLPHLDMLAVNDMAEKIGKYGAEKSYETAREILLNWCARLVKYEARGQIVPDILPGDGDIFRKIQASYPPRHFLSVFDKLSQLFLQVENYNLDKRQAILGAFQALQNPGYTIPNI